MDRDFLSLRYQSASINSKEQVNDDSQSSVRERSQVMQWSFSNKVSAVPQLLSFKPPMSTTNQGNCTQAGSHYTMRVYNPQELNKLSSQPNQATTAVSSSASVFQSTITNGVGNPCMMRSQSFGGAPNGSVVGSTDLRNAGSPTTLPTQLTIFYGGSVNVYEDISPETAKAIMLLAGNGSSQSHKKQIKTAVNGSAQSHNTQNNTAGINGPSSSHNTQTNTAKINSPSASHITQTSVAVINAPSASHNAAVEVAAPRPTMADGFVRSWSFSGLQRPIPISAKPNVISIVSQASSSSHLSSETPKVVTSVAPPTTTAITMAVPQARNASLARFLEKRKERVISTSPYNLSKRYSDYGVPGSGTEGRSISISSGSTSPLSAN